MSKALSEMNQKMWKMEAVAFYALQSIKGVGFHTLYKIAKSGVRFYDLLFSTDSDSFHSTLGISVKDTADGTPFDWTSFQKDCWRFGVETAAKLGRDKIGVIFYDQHSFPAQLRHINNPPLWLFVQGEILNLHKASIAVVGSRKASDDGLWLTKFVVAALADSEIVTISGLAEGIDQKAHVESMKFSVPTVAILGTGIDSNYPKGSDLMRAEILSKGGTIVSEYLLKQSYSAENFVRRNRIQAGLANAVVPVEWKIKSGTAHTVKFAQDFKRHLIMPYLPNSEIQDELSLVNSYSKGKTFLIPHESGGFVDLIRDYKAVEFQNMIEKTESEEQISFHLE
ncbi:DNA-processing protein DprA [Shewanella oncorhynchi]|uniref:DNA-processing protein DprA n=1 Tax=Shewanella oncorhynchi TaxID=2726434 RepID=UPI0037472B9D